MIERKALAIAVAGAGVFASWIRPRLMRWGATDKEVAGLYPGADIVPDGERAATMAVTIDAAAGQVWPWLVQMGWGRGGLNLLMAAVRRIRQQARPDSVTIKITFR